MQPRVVAETLSMDSPWSGLVATRSTSKTFGVMLQPSVANLRLRVSATSSDAHVAHLHFDMWPIQTSGTGRKRLSIRRNQRPQEQSELQSLG
jgi:hypothetical protein